MGAWGTGIFQDDTACDLRDDYKDYLGDGLTGPEATARILAEYKSSLADPYDASVIWLALAAVQWRTGRLEPETLEQAIRQIDSGSALSRWQPGSRDCKKRREALEKLRLQIMSPQPEAKKIRKRILESTDWAVGDLVSYRLLSGNLIVFRLIGHHSDKGGVSPQCELLDWVGNDLPSQDDLRSAKVKDSNPEDRHKIRQLMLIRLDKNASKRVTRLDFTLEPAQKKGPSAVVLWKGLDDFLKRWFLLE
jgi:hypothetical protein